MAKSKNEGRMLWSWYGVFDGEIADDATDGGTMDTERRAISAVDLPAVSMVDDLGLLVKTAVRSTSHSTAPGTARQAPPFCST